MSNPFNSSSQNFSQYNAAQGHKQNVDANHRAMRNHQASQSGGGGGAVGGLLAVVFLVLVVLVVIGALG
jgi:predicted metalloprotease